PPVGVKPQWLLSALKSDGSRFFYRLSQKGHGFSLVNLSPEAYLTQFFDNGNFTDPLVPPFLPPSFKIKSPLEDGRFYFEGFFYKPDRKFARWRFPLERMLSDHPITIRGEYGDGRWILWIETGPPAYGTLWGEFGNGPKFRLVRVPKKPEA